MPEHPEPAHRPAGCPSWCEDPHDRPHGDHQHFAFLDDNDPHKRQRVRLHRTDWPQATGGATEIHLAIYGPATLGPSGCDVVLTAAEARALAKTLLKAAKLLEAPDNG